MKKLMVVILVLVLLGVGGYMYMKSKNLTMKPQVGTANNKTADNNVFTSIKDALSKSLSLQCNFKDEQGQDTTTYIKAGGVRVVMNNVKDETQPNNVMMKNQKMYMWSDKTKSGFTFTLEVPSISPTVKGNVNGSGSSLSKEDSILATIEKYKSACKAAVIADSFFSVPTDVKFQDMSDFTKNMMKAVPTVPAGDGNVDTQNYVNEMLKKVTPPSEQ